MPLCDFAEHVNAPGSSVDPKDRGQIIGRVDVSEPASISSGIAARYAQAVFELAKDQSELKDLEKNVNDLGEALAASEDLRNLVTSPVYTRDEMGSAIVEIAKKMGLLPVVANTLGLMATKRRLFVVPAMLTTLRALIAEHNGEVTAEVTSAKALTKTQQDKLVKVLKAQTGKDVKIEAAVDETLIGGLVVKVGSKMIDTSIRSKLNSLTNVMKEVG